MMTKIDSIEGCKTNCDVCIELSALNRVLEGSPAYVEKNGRLIACLRDRRDRLIIPYEAIPEMFSGSDTKRNAAKAAKLLSLLEAVDFDITLPLYEFLELGAKQRLTQMPVVDGIRRDRIVGDLQRIQSIDKAIAEAMQAMVTQFKARLHEHSVRTNEVVSQGISVIDPITEHFVKSKNLTLASVHICQVVIGLAFREFGSQELGELALRKVEQHKIFFAWAGLRAAGALLVGHNKIEYHRNDSYDDVLASSAAHSRVLLTNDRGLRDKINTLRSVDIVFFEVSTLDYYVSEDGK